MKVTDEIIYVGVNNHDIDLFEGQYIVPNGMAYNSYVIRDEKIAVMDTVDEAFGEEWLENVKNALDGAKPEYLIIQHMEPDHSANIEKFMEVYPDTKIGQCEDLYYDIQLFPQPGFRGKESRS